MFVWHYRAGPASPPHPRASRRSAMSRAAPRPVRRHRLGRGEATRARAHDRTRERLFPIFPAPGQCRNRNLDRREPRPRRGTVVLVVRSPRRREHRRAVTAMSPSRTLAISGSRHRRVLAGSTEEPPGRVVLERPRRHDHRGDVRRAEGLPRGARPPRRRHEQRGGHDVGQRSRKRAKTAGGCFWPPAVRALLAGSRKWIAVDPGSAPLSPDSDARATIDSNVPFPPSCAGSREARTAGVPGTNPHGDTRPA